MPSLALVMIVKNEQENLSRALTSVCDVVDRMIVVDTGSSDRTKEIAIKSGAEVVDHKWDDDFASARNTGLDSNDCEWVLHLDADEELAPYPGIQNLLKSGQDGIRVRVGVGSGIKELGGINNYFQAIRLFRGDSGLRYVGAIHERIDFKGSDKLADSDLTIVHFGPTLPGRQPRSERNIPILMREIERNPNDPYLLTKLGDEYLSMSDYEAAVPYYSRALKTADRNLLYVSRMTRDLAQCLYRSGEREQSLKLINEMKRIYPDYTDSFYLEGLIGIWEEDWEAAGRSFQTCLELGDPPPNCHSWGGTGTWRARSAMNKVHTELTNRSGR